MESIVHIRYFIFKFFNSPKSSYGNQGFPYHLSILEREFRQVKKNFCLEKTLLDDPRVGIARLSRNGGGSVLRPLGKSRLKKR
jgi:hypothetical protein